MIFNKRYEQKCRLGKGVFGEVYKVLDKKDGKSYYALKFIARVQNENVDDLNKNCENEIKIMKNIKSEYIVKLIDNFYDEIYDGYCIVMELCDSDLNEILNKYKPKGLPLELIKKIFLQLNDVLKEMLEKNSIHRNLNQKIF